MMLQEINEDFVIKLVKGLKIDIIEVDFEVNSEGEIFMFDGANGHILGGGFSGVRIFDDTVLNLLRTKRIYDFIFNDKQKDLWSHIRNVIENYCDKVEASIEKDLGWDRKTPLGQFDISQEDVEDIKKIGIVKDIVDLITTSGKIKYQWWGYTYKIVDKQTDFYQLGFSTEPNLKRFSRYLKEAVNPDRYQFSDGTLQIYAYMYRCLVDIGIENFIKEKKGDGTVVWDYSSIHSALKAHFDFEITGIYWSAQVMRNSEKEQIKVGTLRKLMKIGGKNVVVNVKFELKELIGIVDQYGLSWESVGLALNKISAGGAGPHGFNQYLPFITAYASLGYSVPEIAKILHNYHGFNRHLSKRDSLSSALNTLISLYFGDTKYLYDLFLTPTFHEISNSLSLEQIRRLYSNYLKSTIEKPFNLELFKKLSSKGWSSIDILLHEPSFWHFLPSLPRGRIAGKFNEHIRKAIIPKHFPLLNQIVRKNSPNVNDLFYFLIAPRMLDYCLNGENIENIGIKFKSPSNPNGLSYETVVSVFKKIFHCTPKVVDSLFTRDVLKWTILNKKESIQSYDYFAQLLSKSKNTIQQSKYYFKSFIDSKPNNDWQQLNEKDWTYLLSAQIAVIGPILYNCLYFGDSVEHVVNKIGFFENIEDVERWCLFLFNVLPEKVTKTFSNKYLGSNWWYENWGVNI